MLLIRQIIKTTVRVFSYNVIVEDIPNINVFFFLIYIIINICWYNVIIIYLNIYLFIF